MKHPTKRLGSLLAASLAGLLLISVQAADTKTDSKASTTAPSTQPAKGVNATATRNAIEIQATSAFSRGDYALALPLLEKLQVQLKDDPARLGQVEEQIRIARKALENKTGPAKVPAIDPTAGSTDTTPTSPEERKPHPAPKPGEVYSVAIKDLGNFEYDAAKGGNIPDDIKRLGGNPIRLTGYMIPLDQAENITQFALVPSLFACCFGQPPQIQHTIVVTCPKGKAVGYYPDEIVVEGKLKVEEKKDDGYVVSLFEVDVTSVKPAPK